MKEENWNSKQIQIIASYATIPFVLGIPPIIGWYIGSWFDNYFNLSPYGMYTLLILGIIGGIREAYRIIKKNQDKEI